MSNDLRGKHALVCGGSEGIGRASAEALAALGADVTVLARRPERLAEVAAALPRVHDGQKHRHVAADVSDSAGLAAAVSALCAKYPVHVLVNNTAGPPGGRRTAPPRTITSPCSASTWSPARCWCRPCCRACGRPVGAASSTSSRPR